jgi:hypothetical protein
MLNILRDGLPTNNLHAYCHLSNIQHLPDFDNKMQEISLSLKKASDIQILMKMLVASPRPDGQQRVIYLPRVHNCATYLTSISILLRTIKEVKMALNIFIQIASLNIPGFPLRHPTFGPTILHSFQSKGFGYAKKCGDK